MEKELINNSQSNIYPFHMPGHKRRGGDIGAGLDPYAIDITERRRRLRQRRFTVQSMHIFS